MKVLIVLSVVVAIAFAQFKLRSNQEIQQAREKCIRELNIPQEFIEKINKAELPDTDIMRQFNRCFWVENALWDDIKGLELDNWLLQFKGRIPDEEIRLLATNCNKNEQRSDALAWSFRSMQCLLGSKLGNFYREFAQLKISN